MSEREFWEKYNPTGYYDPVVELEKLSANTDMRAPDECWLWTAGRGPHGRYGRVWFCGKAHYPHRLVWEFRHGPLPEGHQVYFTCGTNLCLNPQHLAAGTPQDVVDNREALGNTMRGETHYARSGGMTEEIVRAARTMYASGQTIRTIADYFEVGYFAIYFAITKKTWRHVT